MKSQVVNAGAKKASADSAAARRGLPQAAAVLAYAGALPLILAAMLVALRGEDFGEITILYMVVFGGALIAFFGGVRWGVAVMMPEGPTFGQLWGGVFPLLYSLLIFIVQDTTWRLILIIVALPLLLIDDLRATRRGSGAPDWYLGVRTPLTILVMASYLVVFILRVAGAN